MPNIPCPDAVTCPCDDSPFANLSSEAPDLPVFLAVYYDAGIPPLGGSWPGLGCVMPFTSPVSQEAANLGAASAAFACTRGGWKLPDPKPPTKEPPKTPPANPPTPPAVPPKGTLPFHTFFNTPQQCGAQCPDGNTFKLTIPAGAFAGASQADADAQAQSYACRQAQLRMICLGNLAQPVCVNTAFDQTIAVSAPGSVAWSISGTLPPGLTFNGGHITGLPTTPGTYTFFVTATAANGDAMTKQFALTVAGITNALGLPDATNGTAYTANVTSAGVTNPLYSIEGGALPDGLTLNSAGVISGTPTKNQTANFILGVTEAGTGRTCDTPGTLAVKGGCGAVPTLRTSLVYNTLPAIAARDTSPPLLMIGAFLDNLKFHRLDGSAPDTTLSLGTGTSPTWAAYSPVKDRFYLADDSGGIFKINPNVPSVVSSLAAPTATATEYPAFFAGGYVYFSGPDFLLRYDTNTDTLAATMTPPVIAGYSGVSYRAQACYVTSTAEIWVPILGNNDATFNDTSFLGVYDAVTLALKAVVNLPQGPSDTTAFGMQYAPTSDTVYFTQQNSGESNHVFGYAAASRVKVMDVVTAAVGGISSPVLFDPTSGLVLFGTADQTILAVCPLSNTVLGATGVLASAIGGACYSGYTKSTWWIAIAADVEEFK